MRSHSGFEERSFPTRSECSIVAMLAWTDFLVGNEEKVGPLAPNGRSGQTCFVACLVNHIPTAGVFVSADSKEVISPLFPADPRGARKCGL